MSDDVRIVLVGQAKAAHDKMLDEVRSDSKTTINSSRLINWVVSDYFNRYFDRRKKALFKEHFNPRKFVLEAMKIEDPWERKRALQEAARHLGPALTPRVSKRKPDADLSDV